MYPSMPYLYASGHSVTVGAVKAVFFIGTPFDVNQCINLVQIWRSCMCHERSSSVLHLFPLFKNCVVV